MLEMNKKKAIEKEIEIAKKNIRQLEFNANYFTNTGLSLLTITIAASALLYSIKLPEYVIFASVLFLGCFAYFTLTKVKPQAKALRSEFTRLGQLIEEKYKLKE